MDCFSERFVKVMVQVRDRQRERNQSCGPPEAQDELGSPRLALLRIGEVAEFAVSRPGGAVTVRAAMAEREPAARSK
jgi:hypothetical protein